MYKHLLARSAKTLVRIGRRILAGLCVDPRMGEAIAALEAVQESLEAKVAAWEAASDAAERASTDRATAYRALSNTLREFAFIVLSVTGNHHNLDPYLRYFPDGYGDARTLLPVRIIDFTRLLLTKLEEEVDPKILGGRDVLTTALEALVNAETDWELASRARAEAFGVMQSEKRIWTHGLTRAKALAEFGCFYYHAYVRLLFEPAAHSRGNGNRETAEEGEASESSTLSEPAECEAPESSNLSEPAECEAPESSTAPEPAESEGAAPAARDAEDSPNVAPVALAFSKGPPASGELAGGSRTQSGDLDEGDRAGAELSRETDLTPTLWAARATSS